MVVMKPYWFIRTIAGVTMDVGALLGMWNFYMTVTQGRRIQAMASSPSGAVPDPQWT
jgi:cbb3-type cytochrome oxidase subunit 1